MKQLPIVALCLMFAACGSLQAPPDTFDPAADPAAEPPMASATLPQPSVTDLLVLRLVLCAEPAAQRSQAIRDHASTAGQGQSADGTGKLRQLLLMSCDMGTYRAAIGEVLVDLRSGEWPEGYQALFELVQTGADALKSLERQRDTLQVRLDDTIRGITHIEEAIDARRESSHLAE